MRLAILVLCGLCMLYAQDPEAKLPPEPNIALLQSLPLVHHESEDLLWNSWVEYWFGCDHFPQTIPGLWNRFACHARKWVRLRTETINGEFSWPALREWKLVQDSFKDLNILVKNE